MIPEAIYKQIIKYIPILCVDIIIKNKDGEYLLIKRKNKPLKGEWWIIGGRVHHGENLIEAAKRKVKQEVGLNTGDLKPLGYYEEFFDDSPFKSPIHTISFVFSTVIKKGNVILDNQSSGFGWFKTLPKKFTDNFKKAYE